MAAHSVFPDNHDAHGEPRRSLCAAKAPHWFYGLVFSFKLWFYENKKDIICCLVNCRGIVWWIFCQTQANCFSLFCLLASYLTSQTWEWYHSSYLCKTANKCISQNVELFLHRLFTNQWYFHFWRSHRLKFCVLFTLSSLVFALCVTSSLNRSTWSLFCFHSCCVFRRLRGGQISWWSMPKTS